MRLSTRFAVDTSRMIVNSMPIEVGMPAFPVIRVAGQRDPLVRLKLDKSKGSGTDGMLPHFGRGNMAWIDHRIAGGQQHDKGRLWPSQAEGDLVVAVGRHLGEVAVPRLARIDPQLVVRFAEQQVPGAFDVRGGEEVAVVPLDTLAQRERQLGPVLTQEAEGYSH